LGKTRQTAAAWCTLLVCYHHSLLRQVAAQKQEKQSSKNEKYTQLQKKN